MFLLRIKDRVECCKGTGLHGGDTAQKKTYTGRGGHRTALKEKLRFRTSMTEVVGWSAGRPAGRPAG